MTTYTDNGHGNWVDAMPICEPVSMIMEAAALLVDDMTRTFFFLITNMTTTLYKRKGVVSEISHKAWRQLMLSDIDNLKYPNMQHIPKLCLIVFLLLLLLLYYFFLYQSEKILFQDKQCYTWPQRALKTRQLANEQASVTPDTE